VYAIEWRGSMPFDGTAIVKHDLVTGTVTRKDFGPGRHPGEFVFVDDLDRRAEDGGWLVGFVHDDRTSLAELVVLDAGDVGSPAITTVHTTRRVPYGLHGSWTPSRLTHPCDSRSRPATGS
jgi:carotenoid cleavage dioxygenase